MERNHGKVQSWKWPNVFLINAWLNINTLVFVNICWSIGIHFRICWFSLITFVDLSSQWLDTSTLICRNVVIDYSGGIKRSFCLNHCLLSPIYCSIAWCNDRQHHGAVKPVLYIMMGGGCASLGISSDNGLLWRVTVS